MSLASFVWAQCLVRSRAMDLAQHLEGARRVAAAVTDDATPAAAPVAAAADAGASGAATAGAPAGPGGEARAAALAADAAAPRRLQCVLPVLDLCNHAGSAATATVAIVVPPGMACNGGGACGVL